MNMISATIIDTPPPAPCGALQSIREGLRFVEDRATGQRWFVARDVCERLGTDAKDIPAILNWDKYRPLASLRGITTIEGINKLSGLRKDTRMLAEPGLYRLVFRSHKPEAVRFQEWICEEVLPAICKHGGYFTPLTAEKVLDDPSHAIDIARKILADREEREQRHKLRLDGADDLVIDV